MAPNAKLLSIRPKSTVQVTPKDLNTTDLLFPSYRFVSDVLSSVNWQKFPERGHVTGDDTKTTTVSAFLC